MADRDPESLWSLCEFLLSEPWGDENPGTEYVRADLAGPVRVKPLEWENYGTTAVAVAPLFGRLRVDPYGSGGNWIVSFSVPGYSNTFTEGEWPTLEAAKAAAQADYEARVLACLKGQDDE